MRIALCVSGQPRGLPLCLDIIKEALIEPNSAGNEIDIFLHAWHDEKDVGRPYNSAQPSQNGRVGLVKANTQRTLLDFFKPKKHIIEPQREFPQLRGLKSDPTANQELLGSNFYSVYMANELKRQYEQENNFTYDVVLRTRYDIFYFLPIKINDYLDHLDKIVVRKKFQDDQDNKNNSNKPMVDILAFGGSKKMDVFCSVYPNMVELNKVINPPFGENYLGCLVRVQNNIELHKAPFDFEILHRVIDLSTI